MARLQHQRSSLGVEEWIAESKELRIFILGSSGSGKSALINSLLKHEVAQESHILDAEESKDAQLQYKGPIKTVERLTSINHISVTLWESCSLNSLQQQSLEQVADQVKKGLEVSNAHLYIYCVPVTSRPTNTESKLLKLITDVLGPTFWKRAVFALTFSNELHLPKGKTFSSLEEYCKHYLMEWKSFLHDNTLGCGSGLIPTVMTGYRNEPLLGDHNWSAKFWHTCITRINCLALPAFLAINPNKMGRDHLARYVAAVDFESEKKVSKFSTLGSSSIAAQLFSQIKDMVAEVVEKKVVQSFSDETTSPVLEVNLSNLRLLKKEILGHHYEVRILEVVMNNWLEIGDLLGIDDPTLRRFGEQSLKNPLDCCRYVFQEWIKKGGTKQYPCTWGGVIQLLKDIRCNTLAAEVRKMKLS